MDIRVPRQEYADIEAAIHSAESPVGIDAKKTHVLILHLLMNLDRRVRLMEETLERLESRGSGDGTSTRP